MSCELAGAYDLIDQMNAMVDRAKTRIVPSPCIGQCDGAPAAIVGKRIMRHATVEKLMKAIKDGHTDAQLPDYEDFEAYKAKGGYKILAKIMAGEISADEAVSIMSNAGLRGLGGAGFPAGKKWGFVRDYAGPRYMTINGDEGEPGTFKDRWWLERQPHSNDRRGPDCRPCRWV